MTGPELLHRVQHKRKQAGLNRTELALRVGVSHQAAHAIEQGRHVPSTMVALKLVRELNCTVEELFQ